MVYKLIIRPEARADLLDAFHWYEEQRTGLGHDFKLCVDEVMSMLSKHPNLFPSVHKHVRRAFIKRFPFGIFYIVVNETVVILAVLHARRDPANWKKRL